MGTRVYLMTKKPQYGEGKLVIWVEDDGPGCYAWYPDLLDRKPFGAIHGSFRSAQDCIESNWYNDYWTTEEITDGD